MTTYDDLTTGTMWIHVYYLACGHITWLPVPPAEPPATMYCRCCDAQDRIVMAYEGNQVAEVTAMTDMDAPQTAEQVFITSEQGNHIRQAWYIMDGPHDRPKTVAECHAAIEDLLLGDITGIRSARERGHGKDLGPLTDDPWQGPNPATEQPF